jgi:hypothetical protein
MMTAHIRNGSPKCQLCYRTAHPKAAASIALCAPRNAYASTIDLPSRSMSRRYWPTDRAKVVRKAVAQRCALTTSRHAAPHRAALKQGMPSMK